MESKKIYSPLDWYKNYIKITHKNDELHEEEIIKINEDKLDKKLSSLNIKDKFNK